MKIQKIKSLNDLYGINKTQKKNLPDPRLITTEEYLSLRNPEGKIHESGSYKQAAEEHLKTKPEAIKDHDHLLKRKIKNGITFEFRAKTKGMFHDQKLSAWDFMISVFDMDTGSKIGAAQNEWGCLLITVASQYQGFGIGGDLLDLCLAENPYWNSGGFTQSGLTNAAAGHARIIRRAMSSGFYSQSVKLGKITAKEAKNIISTICPKQKKQTVPDLSSTPLKDCMLFTDGYSDYCLYDPKIRLVMDNQKSDLSDNWTDKFILGHAHITGPDLNRIWHISGKTRELAEFMMEICLEHAKKENRDLIVPEQWASLLDPKKTEISEPTVKPGQISRIVHVKSSKKIIESMSKRDIDFRSAFDKYKELEIFVQEYCNAMDDYKVQKQVETQENHCQALM